MSDEDVLRRATAARDFRTRLENALASPPYEAPRRRSSWDFVLEEMAWLAIDFAGERRWKRAAAAAMACAVVSTGGKPQTSETASALVETNRKRVLTRAVEAVAGALSLIPKSAKR